MYYLDLSFVNILADTNFPQCNMLYHLFAKYNINFIF